DFHGAAALAPPGGFARSACLRSARDHGVLTGDPAAPGALQESRNAIFNRSRADHLGFTQANQGGAFSAGYAVWRNLHLPHVSGGALTAAKQSAAGVKQAAERPGSLHEKSLLLQLSACQF